MTDFLIDVGPYVFGAITILLLVVIGCALIVASRADDLLEATPHGAAPAAPDTPGAGTASPASGEGAGPSTVHPDWDAEADRAGWPR